MNTLLWIVQALLALLLIAGGGYKVASAATLTAQFDTVAPLAWRLLGVLELIGGVLLLLPASLRFTPNLTSITAVVLLLETIGISLLYARYSTSLSAENPLVWSVLMVVLLAIVAYGRNARTPALG